MTVLKSDIARINAGQWIMPAFLGGVAVGVFIGVLIGWCL